MRLFRNLLLWQRNQGKMMTQQHLNPTAHEPVAPPAPAAPATSAPAQVSQPPVPAPVTPSQLKKEKATVDDTKQVDADLVTILSWPRGYDGQSEKLFQDWIIRKLNSMGHKPTMRSKGCVSIEIPRMVKGQQGVQPRRSVVLFSCHTDTVHSASESNSQQIAYDPGFDHIMLANLPADKKADNKAPKWHGRSKSGTCLGADDGAGVWMLLKMIEAKVPGAYVFHRGEERGCIGSYAMATDKNDKKWLEWFDIAVAFDRPKDFEVITHQAGAECCSQKFAKALCDKLNGEVGDQTLKFEPSNRGGVTDTKQYRGIIAECVNVAVGYYDHHTTDEYLDYGHLKALLAKCTEIDWDSLPVDRKPSTEWTATTYGGSGYGYGAGGMDSFPRSAPPSPAPAPAAKSSTKKTDDMRSSKILELYNEVDGWADIEALFYAEPEETAKFVFLALIEARMALVELEVLRGHV